MLISSIMPIIVGVVKEGVRSFTSPIVMTAVPVPTKKNCGASRAWGREEERKEGEGKKRILYTPILSQHNTQGM